MFPFTARKSAAALHAETVEAGPSRRGLLGAACACCLLPRLRPAAAQGVGQGVAAGPARPIHATLDGAAQAIEAKMIAWRRDIHQHPELGNQERRTAGLVAAHLRGLGYEVREGVAVTGIVAVLRGKSGPGPVIALRADMDALPVAEEVDLPFASKTTDAMGRAGGRRDARLRARLPRRRS